MKLQSRLLILVLILVITPLVIVALWNLKSIEDQALQQSLSVMEESLHETSRNLQGIHDRAATTVALIAAQNDSRQYLSAKSESVRNNFQLPTMLKLLSQYQSAYESYELIAVLTKAGEIDIGSGNESAFDRSISRALIGNMNGESVKSQWFSCKSGTGLCLFNIAPVLFRDSTAQPVTSNGQVTGYIASIVNTQPLWGDLEKAAAGFYGGLHLIDNHGQNWNSDVTAGAVKPVPEARELLVNNELTVISATQVADNLWVQAAAPKYLQARRDEIRFNFLVVASIAGLVCGLLLISILRRFVFKPLESMKQFALLIGTGDYKTALPVHRQDEIGELGHALEAMRSELVDSHSQIQSLAFTDPLTGLDNRNMFATKLSYVIGRSDADRDRHALMFIDLDNFKQINDTLGHSAGDQLLIQVAERLKNSTRTSRGGVAADDDAIARFGGDEFQILLPDSEDTGDATLVAERIVKGMRKPFVVNDQSMHISVSVGIAIYPVDGVDVETLTKNADAAMYHAKRSGRNQFQYFSDNLNANAIADLKLQSHLRNALKRNELSLVFQAKVDGGTGSITGTEALTRWYDPELGHIPPDQFIEIAEKYGLMEDLTGWLIDKVCATLAMWSDIIPDDFAMCLNVSGQDISRGKLPETLHRAMTRHGITGKHLTIELTESSLLETSSDPQQRLAEIRALGVSISLDDFGTGYSSLAYLRRLPIDELKIDRSFMQELCSEPRAKSIVAAMGTLAEALGMEWTAEGIETVDQLRVIRELGGSNIQGYLVSKPIPAAEFADLLNAEHLPWLPHWISSRQTNLSIV